MKRVALLLMLVSFVGCESDERRKRRLADDYCKCFRSVNDIFNEEAVRLVEEGVQDTNDLTEFDPAKTEKLAQEFIAMTGLVERAGVIDCARKVLEPIRYKRHLISY